MFSHYAVALLTAALAIGVMVQLAKSPDKANTLFAATTDTYTGIIHGLEGRVSS